MENRLRRFLFDDPRAAMVFMDVALLMLCLSGVQLLRGGDPRIRAELFVIVPLLAMPIFIRLGLYRAVLRYISTKAIAAVGMAVSLHVVTLGLVMALMGDSPSYRVLILYWLLALMVTGGSRVLLRSLSRWAVHGKGVRTNVAIYGAGSAGAELAEALQLGGEYRTVAFIDDQRELQGREIRGLHVFSVEQFEELKRQYDIKEVLLAIPSVSRVRRNQITHLMEKYHVRVRTIPTLRELVSEESKVSELRELDLDDLLEREPVTPNTALLERSIAGKSVMVTGAGGSIGSELCRQILKYHPRQLLLFERSEYSLYMIEREICACLRKEGLGVEVIPLLGSVLDECHITRVLSEHNVNTVYHAAAYKHVPIVEHNPLQGIANNVFGTLRCARAAIEAGVEAFTLVSTDKAVRPTNVMGASKRIAELIVQALATADHVARFTTVRFGNVLGSSGSVVPLFREQIAKGGPITITHRDVTRYFMTIPEAAQLVIQASAMGADGDVFVLDMGEPVRIIDLARRMVALSGLTIRDDTNPTGDIELRVTQLRPGEKLHEELVIGGQPQRTMHARIMRVKEESVPWPQLQELLDGLNDACEDFDTAAAYDVLRTLTGYQPTVVTELRPQAAQVPGAWPQHNAAEGGARYCIN